MRRMVFRGRMAQLTKQHVKQSYFNGNDDIVEKDHMDKVQGSRFLAFGAGIQTN